jgi:hypothetical protein
MAEVNRRLFYLWVLAKQGVHASKADMEDVLVEAVEEADERLVEFSRKRVLKRISEGRKRRFDADDIKREANNAYMLSGIDYAETWLETYDEARGRTPRRPRHSLAIDMEEAFGLWERIVVDYDFVRNLWDSNTAEYEQIFSLIVQESMQKYPAWNVLQRLPGWEEHLPRGEDVDRTVWVESGIPFAIAYPYQVEEGKLVSVLAYTYTLAIPSPS